MIEESMIVKDESDLLVRTLSGMVESGDLEG